MRMLFFSWGTMVISLRYFQVLCELLGVPPPPHYGDGVSRQFPSSGREKGLASSNLPRQGIARNTALVQHEMFPEGFSVVETGFEQGGAVRSLHPVGSCSGLPEAICQDLLPDPVSASARSRSTPPTSPLLDL